MNIMSCFTIVHLWICHVVHPYHFCLSSMAHFHVSICDLHVYLVMLALLYFLVVDPYELVSCLALVSCMACCSLVFFCLVSLYRIAPS